MHLISSPYCNRMLAFFVWKVQLKRLLSLLWATVVTSQHSSGKRFKFVILRHLQWQDTRCNSPPTKYLLQQCHTSWLGMVLRGKESVIHHQLSSESENPKFYLRKTSVKKMILCVTVTGGRVVSLSLNERDVKLDEITVSVTKYLHLHPRDEHVSEKVASRWKDPVFRAIDPMLQRQSDVSRSRQR